jgi:hypothetical protein
MGNKNFKNRRLMTEEELYKWIYNLKLQTLTDELKDTIVEKIQDLVWTLTNK